MPPTAHRPRNGDNQNLLSTGPVAGIINNILTPRITIMIGGALMSVGLVSASFSTDSLTLLVLFGLVTGGWTC